MFIEDLSSCVQAELYLSGSISINFLLSVACGKIPGFSGTSYALLLEIIKYIFAKVLFTLQQ